MKKIGIVGAGVMGQGIAQVAVTGGLDVALYDARSEAVSDACAKVAQRLERLEEKGRLDAEAIAAAKARLSGAASLSELADCDVVVEAIVENLDAKRAVFEELEKHLRADAILATNTSSLPIASVARGRAHPGRIAGMHFFNPVPVMKLVEVIAGPATAPQTVAQLTALAERMGRTPVTVKDSPGFLVNLGGRAYPTEGLAVLSETAAAPADIDAVMRDCWGFRMGPFELMDLTGIDVNYPVTQIIHRAFGYDPRLRTRPQHALQQESGRLGRKTGIGFYDYGDDGAKAELTPVVSGALPARVVLADDSPLLQTLCIQAGVETHLEDDGASSILAAPLGYDTATLASERNLDFRRLVAIDPLGETAARVTMMTAPGANGEARAAVAALCQAAGRAVTAIQDSPGFIGQRIVAMVVNLGCEMAQIGLATPGDIDTAMRLGLNYPQGPLQLCDALGAAQVHEILCRMQQITGDDRYRPSLWLRRRAQLGLSALQAA